MCGKNPLAMEKIPWRIFNGVKRLYPDKKLVVLWDGVSYHWGADFQEFLA
jgi:hypothetical protein